MSRIPSFSAVKKTAATLLGVLIPQHCWHLKWNVVSLKTNCQHQTVLQLNSHITSDLQEWLEHVFICFSMFSLIWICLAEIASVQFHKFHMGLSENRVCSQ